MESNKTLHELCDALGVTRRAVQGYEKAGLVRATARNKYGHLLYDEGSQKRIAKIRLYQQFGFKIREIKWLIDAPGQEVKAALEKKILSLEEEQVQIGELIEKAKELIQGM